MASTSIVFKTLSKVNYHPMGDFSPSLVPLDLIHLSAKNV
jgi:hypothetical protein